MVTWWLFVMGFYMFKSLEEFFLHGRYDYHQGVRRIMGIDTTYGNVNEFAGCLTFTLPALYFVFRSRAEFSPRFRKWLNWGLSAYLLMAGTCIVESNSRSGMVKGILFFLLVCMRGGGLFKKLGYLMAVLVLLLAIWVVMPEANRNRFRTIWDPSAGPKIAAEMARTRLEGEGLIIGLQAFEMSPLTGLGIGNFAMFRARYYDGLFLQAHNLGGQAWGRPVCWVRARSS